MKQKTVMMELIDKLNSIVDYRYSYGIDSSTYKSIIEMAQQLLEKEKEQMMGFCVKRCNDTYGIDEPNGNPNYDRNEGEHYYNKTFKQD